jgi:predicted metal-dependent hydrolase
MFSKRNKRAGSPTNKTKEELIADLQKNAVWLAKMKFVKNIFYPALCKATNSIEDALQNLTIINSVIMEKFLGKMKEVKMRDIDIYSNLAKDDPHYENMKEMLGLFDDLSVFEAKEYLEGLKQEINLFLNEEQRERKLEDLKTRWMDEK